jgi:hypothetical protein
MTPRGWHISHAGSSRSFGASILIFVFVALLFSSQLALAQFTQQGKLVGTGAVGQSQQGQSVAVSADSSTAIVGGPGDNSGAGATWVWTRSSNGVWTQQGGKLVGIGAVGNASQGQSVGLSADGNTAIVGAPGDNSGAGAAWIYTRSNGVWTQQGGKLVGIGAVGNASQGQSVGLSADGNTAIVGGPGDNSGAGATWFYTGSNGGWTQQDSKLVGPGAVGNANQGWSVALSGDGTAIVGGPADASGAGAWWTPLIKLVGTGAVGNANQGWSVALSGDGRTAIVGGPADASGAGAAWVYGPPSLEVIGGDIAAVGIQGRVAPSQRYGYHLSADPFGTVNYSISGLPSWLTPDSGGGANLRHYGHRRICRVVHGGCKREQPCPRHLRPHHYHFHE